MYRDWKQMGAPLVLMCSQIGGCFLHFWLFFKKMDRSSWSRWSLPKLCFCLCTYYNITFCMRETVCAQASGAKWFLFDSISFHCITQRCQWEVCVAIATATHPLSIGALLMMFSSSQTITRDTWTDEGNMSSFSCQECLRAVDVQMPSTASRMDDQKRGAE